MGDFLPTQPIEVEDTPESNTDLWTMSSFFMLSWVNSFKVSTTWYTEITLANNGAEKRISRVAKPSRVLSINLQTFSRPWAAINLMKRMGIARSFAPIYCDATKVTLVTGNVFTCDTTFRRFFTGMWVVIYVPTAEPELSFWDVEAIESFTDSSITIAGGVTRTYPPGTRIAPLIEVDLMLDSSATVITDDKIEFALTCRESEGPSCLPALASAGNTIPTFFPQLDWSSSSTEGFHVENRTMKSGKDDIYELIGPRPRFVSGRQTYNFTRALAWSILQFFDSVCGMTYPFYVLSMLNPFQVLSVGTTSLTVTADGPLQNWKTFGYIGIVERDTRTPYVRPITDVTRSAGVDTITFSPAIPSLAIGNVRQVTPAFLCRFDSDEIVDEWVTDTQCRISFTVIELLSENSYPITGI